MEHTVNPLPSLSSYKLHICTSAWCCVPQLSSVFVEKQLFQFSVGWEMHPNVNDTWTTKSCSVKGGFETKLNVLWKVTVRRHSHVSEVNSRWPLRKRWFHTSFLQKMWNQHSVPSSSKIHFQHLPSHEKTSLEKQLKKSVRGTFCKQSILNLIWTLILIRSF